VGPTLRRKAAVLRTRPARLGLLVALGVGILGAIWCGWTAYRVYSDLDEAKDQATILEASISRGDIDGARQANERFQDLTESAGDRTDGIAWKIIEATPIVGDDAEGLGTISDVMSDLAQDGIAPILDSASQLNAGSFAPGRHQFPLDRIAGLVRPAAESSTVFTSAAARLHAIDSDGFSGPLQRQLDVLRDQVDTVSTTLQDAVRATKLMPRLLGGDGPKNYLLVFQNNAEVRATGGLPGVMSLIHAENGRVDITRQGSAGAMGELPKPVLPLTGEERSLYGPQLGTYFLDSNFTPDFPRAADLWRARWKLETGGDIDGVFVVDPVAVSYLLGPDGVLQVDGRSLTEQTLVTEVEHLAYLRYDNQFDQDDFFNAVARAAFDSFANGGGSPLSLVQGLMRGVDEGRIRMHSFHADDQAIIDGTAIAGELVETTTHSPQVGVYLNDGTGAKMSFFLDHEVSVTSAGCDDGRQRLVARLRITSDTPADVRSLPDMVTGFKNDGFADSVRKGDQVVVANIYAPVDGAIQNIAFDGAALDDPAIDHYGDREVIALGIPLEPDQTRIITWSMVTGPDQTGPTDVSVTPGPRSEDESSVAPSTC
jgi:hypothetical protein